MKRALLACLLLASAALAQTPAAPSALSPAELQRKVEQQVRRLYALGPSYTVKASVPTEAPVGLLQITVEVSSEGQTDNVPFFISRDGRYFLRGELFDTTMDPFAETRKQITVAGAPTKGPAGASVVVVEYSDFQCPTCRQLYSTLKALVPQYPQVRFVYKDFPLEQIHPWSMTAALAGRCAYQQSPAAFWKLHDQIFDNQEIISATTVWDTMLDYAARLGLNTDTFRACMSSTETRAQVDASVQQGLKLKIANTPTVFVNGRRFIGADRQALEQFINFELAATAKKPQ